jgi:hypothetical protein
LFQPKPGCGESVPFEYLNKSVDGYGGSINDEFVEYPILRLGKRKNVILS